MKMSRILILLAVVLCACQDKLALDKDGVPNTLVIGVFAGDDPQQTGNRLNDVGKYLEKKLNKKVEIVKTADYTAVIEALYAKKVHMAYLSPFSYILATKKVAVEPLVNIGVGGKTRSYYSVIATNKNTGIKSMDDVKAKSKELALCFTDPASTSGHLIPASYFQSIGLDPNTSFKQKLFASGHGASAMSVLAGKVDVGCFWDLAIPLLEQRGIAKEGDLIVLWKSKPIVSDPVVMRADINKEFTERVRQALLDLSKEDPKVFEEFCKMYYTDPKGYQYIVAYDSMYDGIRKIEAEMKDVQVSQ